MSAKPLLSALLLSLTALTTAYSQEEAPAHKDITTEKPEERLTQEALNELIANSPAVLTTSTAPADIARCRETVTVSFPDENTAAILRTVADLYELNLIIPAEIKECRSCIHMRDVGWREVFDTLLEPLGYTYTVNANVVKVVDYSEGNPELINFIGTQLAYSVVRLTIHEQMLKALAEHPEKAATEQFKHLVSITPNDSSNEAVAGELSILAYLKDMEVQETAEWIASLAEE